MVNPTVTVTPRPVPDSTWTAPDVDAAAAPTDGTTIQPNIVHIFWDDPMLELLDFMAPRQDWGGFEPFYPQMPFLNAMISRGVLLLDQYVNTVCSTSRASLLSGLYPHTTGIGTIVSPGRAGAAEEFNVQASYNGFETMASSLTTAGYSTACIGKWHLALLTTDTPAGTGFPHIKNAAGGRFNDGRCTFANLVGAVDTGYYDYDFWNDGVLEPNETTYATVRQVNEGIDFCTNAVEPFFLYFPVNDTHDPLDLPPAGLARSAEFDPPAVQATYPNYAAKAEALDRELERLWDNIPIQKRDRTLFIVSSDNGSSADVLANARDQFGKGIGATYDALSDDPLNRFKQGAYEGGGRGWAIISGKQVHDPGRTCDVLTHITDWFPTYMDLAHETHPAGLVGYSLLPIIKNDVVARSTWARQQVMFSNFSPNGDWTAIGGAETSTNFLRRGFSTMTNVPGRYKLLKDLILPDRMFQLEDADGMRVDPFEQNPLDYSSGANATIKTELDNQLTAELAR